MEMNADIPFLSSLTGDMSAYVSSCESSTFICGLSGVTSYTYKGLTVESVFTKPVIPWEEEEEIPEAERVPPELWENGNIPVMEARYRTEYNKVYII